MLTPWDFRLKVRFPFHVFLFHSGSEEVYFVGKKDKVKFF